MTLPRRDFLTQAATVAACGVWGRRFDRGEWAVAPEEVMPEVDEGLARRLALTAMEAARAAGAEFADIRLSGFRYIGLATRCGADYEPVMYLPSLRFTTDYGIRVIVDGLWGFAGGYIATPDAIADAARTAVVRARASGARKQPPIELAPAPRVEDGRWATPTERNALAVPIDETGKLLFAALNEARTVKGLRDASASVDWQYTLQVFASTEESLIVQRLVAGGLYAEVYGASKPEYDAASAPVQGVLSGGYGYEALTRPGFDLGVALRDAAERAVARSGPRGPEPISVDVGRYDLVFDHGAVRTLVSDVLVEALNLERALGYRANGMGTSFAAPPLDVLGKYQVASPLLTLRADRSQPHANATVGWDDEGVKPVDHTFIDQGVITDYMSSRQTAVALAPYYAAQKLPAGSRGSVYGRGQIMPEVKAPNITLAPGPDDVALDDIVADTKRGFLVSELNGATDQQLMSGQFVIRDAREIRAGKVGRKMKDIAFQFLTSQFWKKVDAVGGAKSVLGHEWSSGRMTVVPMRVREVNVLNTAITL